MTNQNQHNPDQLRDRAENYQEQLLNQYSQLIAQNTFEASKQALDDQILFYEAVGVKEGFKQFKAHATELMQSKLGKLNQINSRKILELRASMPELDELDDTPDLQAPSLQAGIDEEMGRYGVLSPSADNSDLPDDLQDALEA
jgi:hypothetical protein